MKHEIQPQNFTNGHRGIKEVLVTKESERKSKREEFRIVLTAVDEVRVRFDKEKGKVVEFAVQYVAKIQNRWEPIVRFDTAHGKPHIDVTYPDGSKEKKEFQYFNYNQAMTFAIREIQEHWEMYREKYERKLQ